MRSKYNPQTTEQKLREAEMLAGSAAADHIRDVRKEVAEWNRHAFKHEIAHPFIAMFIGFIAGMGLMWLMLGGPDLTVTL